MKILNLLSVCLISGVNSIRETDIGVIDSEHVEIHNVEYSDSVLFEFEQESEVATLYCNFALNFTWNFDINRDYSHSITKGEFYVNDISYNVVGQVFSYSNDYSASIESDYFSLSEYFNPDTAREFVSLLDIRQLGENVRNPGDLQLFKRQHGFMPLDITASLINNQSLDEVNFQLSFNINAGGNYVNNQQIITELNLFEGEDSFEVFDRNFFGPIQSVSSSRYVYPMTDRFSKYFDDITDSIFSSYNIILYNSSNYQMGVEDGRTEGLLLGHGITDVFGFFGDVVDSFSSILKIQIIPGISLGLCISIPIILLIIISIFKIVKG